MKIIQNKFVLSLVFVGLFSCTTNPGDPLLSSLQNQIDNIRIANKIPAIAYGVIKNDSIIVANVIGYRNIETSDEAGIKDLFHIGSNTKSFTVFLAGKLVEEGLISWDTRFFDLFPEMKNGSDSAYYEITLQRLLSHRARLIPFKGESDKPIINYEKDIVNDLPLHEKRYLLVKKVLTYPPIPLHDHHDDRYSNAGYIAAALMLENSSDKKWEKLVNTMSHELDLNIHIGWPDSFSEHNPNGHINPRLWEIDLEEDLIPIPKVLRSYHYFNQHILLCTPSGHLSISLKKFLEFLRLHIEGLHGKDNYLKSETYKHIFTAYPDYSLGWATRLYDQTCFHHRGSAGTFNSIALILPDSDLGIVVMVNTYDRTGLDEIVEVLINKFS